MYVNREIADGRLGRGLLTRMQKEGPCCFPSLKNTILAI